MARFFLMFTVVLALFVGSAAYAGSDLFLGSKKGKSSSSSDKSGPSLFLGGNKPLSKRKSSAGTKPSYSTGKLRNLSRSSVYGAKNSRQRNAARNRGNTRQLEEMSDKARANRQADFEIMQRQSKVIKEKVSRGLAERKARREQKIAALEGRNGKAQPLQSRRASSKKTNDTKKVYKKEQESTIKKPRRVFNSYR